MPSAVRPVQPRRHVNAQDVAGDEAIFNGRAPNGRPRSVTEMMRRSLPTGGGRSGLELLAGGGSEALARAVKDAENEERRRIVDEDRRARSRYIAELHERGYEEHEIARILGGSDDVVEELRDADPEPDPDEHEVSNEEAIRALEREVAATVERIKATTPPPPLPPPGRDSASSTTASTTSTSPIHASPIHARAVEARDVDRLWDWLRSEKSSPARLFFHRSFETSIDLHTFINDHLRNQTPIRAIDIERNGRFVHAGFFALFPIDPASRTAMLHIYLAPSLRPHFMELFPFLLSGARMLLPPTMALSLPAPDGDVLAWARMFEPFGFTMNTFFVQRGQG